MISPRLHTVLGGGYIALEFSGIFQRFGSEVHTVFRQPLPLRGFDEEVSNNNTQVTLDELAFQTVSLACLQHAVFLLLTPRSRANGAMLRLVMRE